MNQQSIFFLTLLLLTIQVSAELKFVVEIFRHGARGALNDWYDGKEQLDIFGELTATGQRQHYNLGAKLREEYSDFLPREYNHTWIYVRSSDVNRTLQSVSSQLQGMFPATTGKTLPQNLEEKYILPAFKDAKNYLHGSEYALPNQIQVLPIHTQTQIGDKVLQPEQNCKRYSQLKETFYKENEKTIQFINQQFNNTYSEFSKAINQTVSNFDDQHHLEAVFECDRANGRVVPNFSQELIDNSTFLTTLSWNFLYNQPDLLRGLNQPFFSQLQDYMNPVVNNTNKNGLKWVMFSAHDTNVHLISAALNFTSIECHLASRFQEYRNKDSIFYNCEYHPTFTSSLIFELHQAKSAFSENGVQIDQNQFYLKIRKDGRFMNLCNRNSTICSFKEYSQRIKQYSIDFDSVCNDSNSENTTKTQPGEDNQEENSFNYYILGLILQQIIIFACCFIIYKLRVSKKEDFQSFRDDVEMPTRNLN